MPPQKIPKSGNFLEQWRCEVPEKWYHKKCMPEKWQFQKCGDMLEKWGMQNLRICTSTGGRHADVVAPSPEEDCPPRCPRVIEFDRSSPYRIKAMAPP